MKKIIPNTLHNIISRIHSKSTIKSNEASSRQFPYKVEVIAENLYVPWGIDISDDNTLYVTERSGSIRTIKNSILNPQPLITLRAPFISQGEGGLMDISLDPNHSQNNYIYVMHSYTENNQIYNRVVRLVERNNSASIDKIIIDKIPGALIHNGGRIKIGKDQKLYITTGDASNPSLSQDPTSTAGKILRLELDGSIQQIIHFQTLLFIA